MSCDNKYKILIFTYMPVPFPFVYQTFCLSAMNVITIAITIITYNLTPKLRCGAPQPVLLREAFYCLLPPIVLQGFLEKAIFLGNFTAKEMRKCFWDGITMLFIMFHLMRGRGR